LITSVKKSDSKSMFLFSLLSMPQIFNYLYCTDAINLSSLTNKFELLKRIGNKKQDLKAVPQKYHMGKGPEPLVPRDMINMI